MSFLAYVGKRLNKVVVEAPLNKKWAQAINHVIPPSQRKRRDTVWYFDLQWHDVVREMAKYYFVQVSDTSGPATDPPPTWWRAAWEAVIAVQNAPPEIQQEFRGSRARATLFVTADAPRDVIVAAYRALVKFYHPDSGPHGGNPERFMEVQEAYEELTGKEDL